MRFILIFLLIGTLACNTLEEDAVAFTGTEQTLPEDFLAFYQRFHADTAYQLRRITFPLAGIPDNQPFAENFRWQRADWTPHRPFDLAANKMERQFSRRDATTIEEVILQPQERAGILRRFSKLGDEWYLIYYAGMNRLRE